MNHILEKMQKIGILPVVVIEQVEDALPLAKALIKGNLPCAEITFRSDAAKDVISMIHENYPDMLVGAGTILTTKQVDDAIEAGAKFIISPGFDEEVCSYCVEKEILIIPGIATPSELQKAYKMGLRVVKFFPAEAAGGIAMINALSAPYPMMKFVPTGGIKEETMMKYLSNPAVLAIGGTWMVGPSDIKNHNFDKITEIALRAVNKKMEAL